MLTLGKKSYRLLFFFSIFFQFISCKKGNEALLNDIAIDITIGGFDTVVGITGQGFSSNTSENLVKFNGKPAEVITASSIKLTVKVPVKAGTGNVTVTVNGKTVTGPIFNYRLSGLVSTYAGNGVGGYADGQGSKASFTRPTAIVIDAIVNLYVSDTGDGFSHIRKITPDSVVTTLVTLKDAPVGTPPFGNITAMTIGADGNIYEVEYSGVVRKITMAGNVTTYYDGRFTPVYNFEYSAGIAFDKAGNMYISVPRSNQVQIVTPTGVAGNFVGNGENNPVDGYPGGFFNNTGIEFDASGLLYIADFNSNKIRVADATRHVSTIAGFSPTGTINGTGHEDGLVRSATLGNPNDIAFDAAGNLYFTDSGNNMIRMIDADHTRVTTIAGNLREGHKDGAGFQSLFNVPAQLVVSANGTIFVTDLNNHLVRKIVMI
jgi:hypothetical protein